MTNDELEVVKACNAELVKEILKLSQSTHIYMSFIELQANL